ncbi:hypothetical protein LTR53_013946 [Teratosphaeriaceae sp. CCFEE 6253]|nr:hypothetical protein LTR53_013946 [Teratosphaeriaceae sp. CCFEE 6253]
MDPLSQVQAVRTNTLHADPAPLALDPLAVPDGSGMTESRGMLRQALAVIQDAKPKKARGLKRKSPSTDQSADTSIAGSAADSGPKRQKTDVVEQKQSGSSADAASLVTTGSLSTPEPTQQVSLPESVTVTAAQPKSKPGRRAGRTEAERARVIDTVTQSLAEPTTPMDLAGYEATCARLKQKDEAYGRARTAERTEQKAKEKEGQAREAREKDRAKVTAEAATKDIEIVAVTEDAVETDGCADYKEGSDFGTSHEAGHTENTDMQLGANAETAHDVESQFNAIERERVLYGEKCTKFYTGRSNVFTQDQKDRIKALAQEDTPHILYHVHSTQGRRHTQGSATQCQIDPAASVQGQTLHPSIYDFPSLHALVRNLGNRILWNIRHADQFSSYSRSLLFAFVHALGRKLRGETGITLTVVHTQLATNTDGGPAEFYYVPKLKQTLGVLDWGGWTSMPFSKLGAPWYTHEYVAHGVVKLGPGACRQVPFRDFVQGGLYGFAPGLFDEPDVAEMKKLYNRCVQLRYLWYNPKAALAQPCDRAYLDHAARLARLFNTGARSAADSGDGKGPGFDGGPISLQIFLDLVGLSRRQKNDPAFLQFVKDNFTGKIARVRPHEPYRHLLTVLPARDVKDILYPAMTTLPWNLPECKQTMARTREVCAAFGVAVPGEDVPSPYDIDPNFNADGHWDGDLKSLVTPPKRPKKAEREAGEGSADSELESYALTREVGEPQAIDHTIEGAQREIGLVEGDASGGALALASVGGHADGGLEVVKKPPSS